MKYGGIGYTVHTTWQEIFTSHIFLRILYVVLHEILRRSTLCWPLFLLPWFCLLLLFYLFFGQEMRYWNTVYSVHSNPLEYILFSTYDRRIEPSRRAYWLCEERPLGILILIDVGHCACQECVWKRVTNVLTLQQSFILWRLINSIRCSKRCKRKEIDKKIEQKKKRNVPWAAHVQRVQFII